MGARFALDGTERVVSSTSRKFSGSFPKPVPGPGFEDLGVVGVPWREPELRFIDNANDVIYRVLATRKKVLLS